ncbi:MAG: hypothetical protein JXR40_08075 [Pontiellaceae bacterium]|nr:hypothetical protein [Pontiellaceae bacterium]
MDSLLKYMVTIVELAVSSGFAYIYTLLIIQMIGQKNFLGMGGIIDLSIGIIALWAGIYHGTWGILAKRRLASFWRTFILFNLIPGIVGVVCALLFPALIGS